MKLIPSDTQGFINEVGQVLYNMGCVSTNFYKERQDI